MAQHPSILQNQSGGRVSFLFQANNTVHLANTVVGTETVNSLTITDVLWSGDWLLDRGGTRILTLSGSGSWNLVSHGIKITANGVSNVVVTSGSTAGTLIIKADKG